MKAVKSISNFEAAGECKESVPSSSRFREKSNREDLSPSPCVVRKTIFKSQSLKTIAPLPLPSEMKQKAVLARSSSTQLLPDSYQITRFGMPKAVETHSWGKVKRSTKCKRDQIVGPGKYDLKLKWEIPQRKIGGGSKKISFTERAALQAKKTPSVHTYNPVVPRKVLLGHAQPKAENTDHTSNAIWEG